MKITLATLDSKGDMIFKVSIEAAASENGIILADDVPVQLGLLGQRYIYVHYDQNFGNLTFSLRRTASFGYKAPYVQIIDFDAYVPVKRLPIGFLFRASEEMFVKVAIE